MAYFEGALRIPVDEVAAATSRTVGSVVVSIKSIAEAADAAPDGAGAVALLVISTSTAVAVSIIGLSMVMLMFLGAGNFARTKRRPGGGGASGLSDIVLWVPKNQN